MYHRPRFFPNVIFDGFFDEPDLIRKYALSLDYCEKTAGVPGVRTKCLSEIDPELFNAVVNRYLSLYYPLKDTEVEWRATANFQLVDKKYGEGWAHKDSIDGCKATGIVYLDPTPNTNSGTSLLRARDGIEPINTELKHKFYSDEMSEEEAVAARKENNDQFEEILVCKNQYNRFFGFAANTWHKANDFSLPNNETRLTLIMFIYQVNQEYPMERLAIK